MHSALIYSCRGLNKTGALSIRSTVYEYSALRGVCARAVHSFRLATRPLDPSPARAALCTGSEIRKLQRGTTRTCLQCSVTRFVTYCTFLYCTLSGECVACSVQYTVITVYNVSTSSRAHRAHVFIYKAERSSFSAASPATFSLSRLL